MKTTESYLQETYYKQSGKFKVGRTIGATILFSIIIAMLSLVYSALMFYIPFVYLNFIITGGMAIGIYIAHSLVVRIGRIRNGAVNLIVGVILFLSFFHAHFMGYAALHSADILNEPFWECIIGFYLLPGDLLEVVQLLNEQGTWNMSSFVFKGILLTIVWVIEHIVVLAGALFGFFTKNDEIYIESANCWAEEKPLEKVITVLPEAAKSSLEQRNYAVFENSYLATAEEDHCVISYLTDEHERSGEYYLKIENVTFKPDKDDPSKLDKNESTLVMGLRINRSDLDRIRYILDGLPSKSDNVLTDNAVTV